MPKRNSAAYARYSSDNQREESIDAQLRAIKEYAKKNQIRIVGTYVDKALTATNDNRPEFQKMLKDSKKGVFDSVIVYKMNRFARNRYDDAIYKKKLQRNNVSVISVVEQLDDSPMSVMMESFLIGLAEFESKNLAQEVMKGSKENAYSCKHNGGLPPFGYSVDRKTQLYVIDDDKAPIVRRIFDRYLEGAGYTKIANELNEKGHKTSKGYPFSVPAVKTILTNPKYKGTYIYNRAESKNEDGKRNNHHSKEADEIIVVENGMPAIITSEVFQKVQDRIAANTRDHNTFRAKRVYLLSGIIRCGECGAKMIANKAYNKMADGTKKEYFMYRCSNKDHPQNKAKSIHVEEIEEYILSQMEEQIFNDKALSYLSMELNKFSNDQSNQIKVEMQMLQNRLKKKESEIEKIIEAIMDGFKSESLKQKLSILEEQKESIVLDLQKKELIIMIPRNWTDKLLKIS